MCEHFKVDLREFLNPGVDSPPHDSEGYGLSHHAANARVLARITHAEGRDHPFLSCCCCRRWRFACCGTIWRDFSALPRLSFAKSLGVVARWGIAGVGGLDHDCRCTRDDDAPGSWKKQGLLYTLDDSNIAKPVALEPVKGIGPELGEVRRKGLEDLKAALWNYAAQHKGELPPAAHPSIPDKLWEVGSIVGARYRYVAGLSSSQDSRIVVFEPAVHGDQHFVLRLNGRIERLSSDAIRKELQQVTP